MRLFLIEFLGEEKFWVGFYSFTQFLSRDTSAGENVQMNYTIDEPIEYRNIDGKWYPGKIKSLQPLKITAYGYTLGVEWDRVRKPVKKVPRCRGLQLLSKFQFF